MLSGKKPLRHKEKENLGSEESGWSKDIVFSKVLCNQYLIQLAKHLGGNYIHFEIP
jgi:hypothetical protein